MLSALHIENFTIVKQLDLDFAQGMTAFTGETGAGKSIMIDALMLALGERGDPRLIRKGEQKCDITACFHTDDTPELLEWLREHDVPCDDQEIILRRTLSLEGRSKLYINGQPFPAQKVKELGEMLVHIHGQHQHQALLNPTAHRQQLDRFARHDALQEAVLKSYKQCQHVQQQIDALSAQERHQDKMDLLLFQIEELSQLQLESFEFERLSEEHQALHHAQDYLLQSQAILELLDGEDHSISQALSQAQHHLDQLPLKAPSIKNSVDLIRNALIHCEEAISEMRHFQDTVQLDPERLREVEQRLGQLHQVARKYHVDAKALPAHWQSLQSTLATLQATDETLLQLKEELIQCQAVYYQTAAQLSESRQRAGEALGHAITEIIQQLGMPKGKVVVHCSSLEKMQPHGMDKIEYLVCTNPGSTLDALSKIASGGELSRISLAIQVITAQQGSTPTLLFDEVDVGIGGSTAALVGKRLRQLGERLQVFCVTHQPQVASSAHHHFVVSKHSDDEQTFSQITPLHPEQKIDEIARMLGGLHITEQTRLHAKELLAEQA